MTTTNADTSGARRRWEPAPGDSLSELPVKCTDNNCDDDLHCFKQTRQMVEKQLARGTCRACGVHLVELERTAHRDPRDTDYTFAALERELIRYHFMYLPFDQRALDHATRKGRPRLKEAAMKRLRTSVGRAEPFRDGMQTPMEGNTVYYAQHATATCCRTCIEYWHGIRKGEPLTDEELGYLHNLVCEFLDGRLPALSDEPKRVPRRPKQGT